MVGVLAVVVAAFAIIEGGEAPAKRYPWVAQIRSDGGFCTGSLIGGEWVVTAAHCVTDESLSPTARTLVEVRVGSDDLDRGGELRSVRRSGSLPGVR